jgi:hypothetical protein
MGKPWGRLYGGTRNHRKIKLLREKFPSDWRSWYALIDLAIEVDDDGKIYISPGNPYTMKELGKEIGIRKESTTNDFCMYLEQLGLVTRTTGELILNSFCERNYISDSSTPRVQKYREKQKPDEKKKRFSNVSCNKGETHQNRTDTEHIKEPPISPMGGGDNGFDSFWNSYPKKVGRKAALNAWKKARGKPKTEIILEAVEAQKRSIGWTKDDGQYIPNPATWINQGRWDDEIELPKPTSDNPYQGRCKHLNPVGKCPICEKEKGHDPPRRA